MKQPSKPIAWRRRAAAKLQADHQQRLLAASERAAAEAERAARSTRRLAERWDVVQATPEPDLPDPPEGFCWVQLLGDLEPRLLRISPEASAEGASRPDQSAPARYEQPCGPVEPAAKG